MLSTLELSFRARNTELFIYRPLLLRTSTSFHPRSQLPSHRRSRDAKHPLYRLSLRFLYLYRTGTDVRVYMCQLPIYPKHDTHVRYHSRGGLLLCKNTDCASENFDLR